jgi:solute carrier family 10 (sodium/bile acid cotransporter), member 7
MFLTPVLSFSVKKSASHQNQRMTGMISCRLCVFLRRSIPIVMKIVALLNKAGLNLFFLLLLVTVLLAWLFPQYGIAGSPVPLKPVTTFGVAFIFFFYGVRLSTSKLIAGLSHWKLHLVVQGTTFILFPVFTLIAYYFFRSPEYEVWWIGVFYLAVLPSTVSSSVVMVSIAGGNLSAAIFNASISSLIGIVITPLWMSLFIDNSTFSTSDLSGVILDLSLQVLLPVVVGLLLHTQLGHITERYKNQLRHFDQVIILLIVYRAFSESFTGKMFSGFSATEILALSALMLFFFLVTLSLMQVISSMMKFTREDRITIIFCGSKKSLVQGAVMGQVLFTSAATMGMILLPLMIYHTLQLLAGSMLAQYFGKSR